jgi:hypothetical protein
MLGTHNSMIVNVGNLCGREHQKSDSKVDLQMSKKGTTAGGAMLFFFGKYFRGTHKIFYDQWSCGPIFFLLLVRSVIQVSKNLKYNHATLFFSKILCSYIRI